MFSSVPAADANKIMCWLLHVTLAASESCSRRHLESPLSQPAYCQLGRCGMQSTHSGIHAAGEHSCASMLVDLGGLGTGAVGRLAGGACIVFQARLPCPPHWIL